MGKLLLIFLFVSCAAPSYTLKKQDLRPYGESDKITRTNFANNTLELLPVSDNRTNKNLGIAYIGMQYTQTPIEVESSIEHLMKDMLEDSLTKRNLMITSDAKRKLRAEILEIKLNEVIEKMKPERAKCELKMQFNVEDENGNWKGSFKTEFLSAGNLADGTTRIAPTFASCFNDMVERLVNDEKFIAFMNNEGSAI